MHIVFGSEWSYGFAVGALVGAGAAFVVAGVAQILLRRKGG